MSHSKSKDAENNNNQHKLNSSRSADSFDSHESHNSYESSKSHEDVDLLSDSQASGADEREVTFAELGVPQPLVRVLAADDKTTAFPIQTDTLPDSLAGRDILGRGRTGSGKTLAFAIPLVARLSNESVVEIAMHDYERGGRQRAFLPHPRALVLAPTRELVNQIDEVIKPLAQAYGMQTACIYGGVNQNRQVAQLRDGADIVVACPGRLEDLLRQHLLSLESVSVTVLDEADEMADMGFLPAVSRLLSQVDAEGQRMLFSATLDHGVDKVVEQFLTNAKVHAVDSADAQVDTMTHHVFAVSQGNKHEVIRVLASGKGKRIMFTRTKFQAKKMAQKLVHEGIPAVDLQGNLSQNARDRHLAAFTNGEVRVLVATDVAARGIDVSDVELVVQTEPPEDPKSFLHRSGRTARAGESGDVVTLVLPQQQREARSMMRRAGIRVQTEEVTPVSEVLLNLVGEQAPKVKDWTLTVPVVNKPAGSSRRRGGSGASGSSTGSRRSGGRGDRRNESRGGFADEGSRGGSRSGSRSGSRGGSRSGARGGSSSRDFARTSDEYGSDSRGSRSHGSDDSLNYEGKRHHTGKRSEQWGERSGGSRDRNMRSASGFQHSRSKKKSAAPFRRSNGR